MVSNNSYSQMRRIPYASGIGFATAMGKYSCEVTIKFNGNQYNAKSLLNIIAACIKCGSDIEIVCDGADENEALAEATQLIESGLGE